ncbi:MAG: hypothetical protein HOE90_21605 [Bacteriovoracaceae bacterium]|nr:hypothetical protein [Bacteriovoracaceae bacterium]
MSTNQLTYHNNKLLYQLVLRTPKSDSTFLYFTLEASEGLCFYSTLDFEAGSQTRDIIISTPIEHKQTLTNFLSPLKDSLSIQLIKEQTILDQ